MEIWENTVLEPSKNDNSGKTFQPAFGSSHRQKLGDIEQVAPRRKRKLSVPIMNTIHKGRPRVKYSVSAPRRSKRIADRNRRKKMYV